MAKTIPPRRGEVLTPDGMATLRFSEFLENLSSTTNETSSTVVSQSIQNLTVVISALQDQIGTGDALTSDTDSFTVDSTTLFVDQTEA